MLIQQVAQAGGVQSDDDYVDKRVRTALIIGFSAYKTAPLQNPVADATLIAKRLQDAGFRVESLLDLPARELASAVEAFKAKAQGSEIALIYYAGHGLQVDSENYIVPVDFDPNVENPLANLYPVRALLEGLDKAAKARVLLLDACRDNPFGEALRARGTHVSGDGLAPIELPVEDGKRWPQGTSGLLVAYATQPSKTASDGRGSNSPYAAGLAAALATPDADFESVLKTTSAAVRAETGGQQHPEYRSALTGSLYLVARPKPLECDLLAVDTDNDVSLKGVVLEDIDAAKAIPACEAALKEQPGSPRIMHNLGRALEKAGRYQEALDLYHKAAQLGFDQAQLYYGNSLMEGLGGEIDMKTGLHWVRLAYERGNRQAMINYAEYDLSPVFQRSDRVKILQDALRKAGIGGVPDSGVMDDATNAALASYKTATGLEGQRITFQVLDRLEIVDVLFPKRSIAPSRQ
ncbi:caspase family protein [Hyphomicrobium sp.]|uniref:caspase family protein n=1 Tax=Hyphomicrobium sp. TaxID=82 RepID=UPI0025B90F21|nr:caspase family protein [Hyphomicrobium sp.]MCC7252846.1 caspase family protein [Hyphomicrobium sp.]